MVVPILISIIVVSIHITEGCSGIFSVKGGKYWKMQKDIRSCPSAEKKFCFDIDTHYKVYGRRTGCWFGKNIRLICSKGAGV